MSWIKKKWRMITRQIRHIVWMTFDIVVGVDYERSIRGQGGYHSYTPTGIKQIRILTRFFRRENITNNMSFLDVGCGKGRVILFMHMFKFGKIDGIEYSANIAKIAESNIKKLKLRRSRIYTIDALSFSKYNEYNYIFMYNPFGEELMEGFVKQLVAQCNHETTIIYYHPAYYEVLLRNGIIFDRDLGREVSIYKFLPGNQL